MADGAYNRWDLGLKGLGAFGLLLTAFIGVLEYWATANQTIAFEKTKLDSEQRKLYFDKQLEYYLAVTDIVAKIATTSDKGERAKAVEQFDRFYFGSMVVLEDRGDSSSKSSGETSGKYTVDSNVEKHMIDVYRCIHGSCRDTQLQNEALALADACRFSLSVKWQGRIDNLQRGLNLKERLSIRQYLPPKHSDESSP